MPRGAAEHLVIALGVELLTDMPHLHTLAFTVTLVLAGLLGCADSADSAHDIVQKGCDANSDCAGGLCVEGLPGGLCTANCSSQDDCPDSTVCTDTEAHGGVCLFSCTSTQQCIDDVGTGYVCDTESNLSTGEDVAVCIDG